MVLSSISVVSSIRSCSIRAKMISFHTPAFVHARNWLYTLCHGPNRSGRSRHGIPVFSQYTMALSISRLLLPGRPPCSFLSGGNLILRQHRTIRGWRLKHRLACTFPMIAYSFRLSMVRWTALNLYPLTKNLTAQYGT